MAGIDKTYAVSAQGHHLQADGQICGLEVSGGRLVRNEQLNITDKNKDSMRNKLIELLLASDIKDRYDAEDKADEILALFNVVKQSEQLADKRQYCNACGDYVGDGCDNLDCKHFKG